jgi:hypothetical protein
MFVAVQICSAQHATKLAATALPPLVVDPCMLVEAEPTPQLAYSSHHRSSSVDKVEQPTFTFNSSASHYSTQRNLDQYSLAIAKARDLSMSTAHL